MRRDWKSLWHNGRLNQEHWPEGNTITPPMPHVSPDANASAMQVPCHCCFGHIVRTGGRLLDHVTYMETILWEEVESFSF